MIPLKEKMLQYAFRNLKETPTISKVIMPFLRKAGFVDWDIDSIEESYEIDIGDSKIWVDICLKIKGAPVALLQAKSISYSYKFRGDYQKTFRAANFANISNVIMSSGDVWEFYKSQKLISRQNLLTDHNGTFEVLKYLKSLKEQI